VNRTWLFARKAPYVSMWRKTMIQDRWMSKTLAEVIKRIDEIAVKLEQDNDSLEESIKHFEEGVTLTREAQALLSTAEQRVATLIKQELSTDTID
jgi:exodeoxyribonuclease VII small subunit